MGQKRMTRHTPPRPEVPMPSRAVLKRRLAALPPAPEPSNLTPYRENMKTRTVADDDLSAKWRAALEWSALLITARGGTVRPLRELDDVSRAAAMARMSELTARERRRAG